MLAGPPRGSVGMVIDTLKRSMLRSRIAGVAFVLTVAGCVTSPTSVSMPPSDVSPPPKVLPAPSVPSPMVQTGQASWYGEPHHGQRTASGEIYDMRELTAAHRTLPLGTRLLVTNLKNGRTVEVRVNDRGPVPAGRIIDLSYAAAEKLGAVSDGLFPVRVRVVSTPAH
jgi:rare lipoprotein A